MSNSARAKLLTIWNGDRDIHLLCDTCSCIEENRKHTLLVASLIGEEENVRCAMAAFEPRAVRNFTAYFSSGPVQHDIAYGPRRAFRDSFPYTARCVKLGYKSWQCMLFSSRPGLLLSDDDETLWQELSGERFTTPLLRSWVPYIRGKLVEKSFLKKTTSFGCSPALLELASSQLDSIVSAGVKYKKLEFSNEVGDR